MRRIFASWNQLDGWLRQVDGLRRVARPACSDRRPRGPVSCQPMQKSASLEVTITHNLRDAGEVSQLFARRLIALDWDRKGPDPSAYTGRAKTDVRLFNEMKDLGAAVIAAYKGATDNRSHRLVGWVEPGARFKRLNGLLCLSLSKAKVVDASISYLGNLAPRSCTVQTCHNRARDGLFRSSSAPRRPEAWDRSTTWMSSGS